MRNIPVPGASRPLVLALIALLAAGCAGLPPRTRPGAAAFPLLAERGWVLAGPPRDFGPDTLYEEIDGEAELFLPYGFLSLTTGILAPPGRKEAEVRLELFRHAAPRDAFGVFSQHRFPGQEMTGLGDSEAIVSDTSLDFFRGTMFVRIRAASRAATRDDLLRLGKDLSALLPGTGAPPREVEVLRIPGMVEGTVVYHRRAILGFERLAPGYEAKVRQGGKSITVVLLPPDESGKTARSVETFANDLPGWERIDVDHVRADLPSGTLWVSAVGDHILGAAGKLTREEAMAILGELARRLGSRAE